MVDLGTVMEVIIKIEPNLSLNEVLRKLRLRKKNVAIEKSIQVILEKILPVLNIKALYKPVYVEKKDQESIVLDGITFNSRLLAASFNNLKRVFPYVITSGQEVDNIESDNTDYLEEYVLDFIKEMALRTASSYFRNYVSDRFALGRVSTIAPGSLKDWPINQQKELFTLFGNVETLIGVRLTPTYLMVPKKSVSGILFPTQVKFETCQLCPRNKCASRRAPYNEVLAVKYEIFKNNKHNYE